MFSVCAKCGFSKKRPTDKCGKCGFVPQTDEEKAKSLILSTAYEIRGEYRGKKVDELKTIAAAIQAGKHYEFDPDEVRSVIAYAREVLAIPARRLILDGLKWIGPVVAILIAVYLLLFMGK